jgi:WD40-like Beta Propeller Repeat
MYLCQLPLSRALRFWHLEEGGLAVVTLRVLIVLSVAGSALFATAPAQATFPGGNGRIVYVAAGDLITINPDGTGHVQLTSDGDADHPTWSPDGTKIAFDRTGGGNSDIWVINEDGTGLTRLTNGPGSNSHPTWSPDGGRIAFASTRDGVGHIYSMQADGTDQVRLTNSTDEDIHPDWAPDGSSIVFVRVHFGGSLFTINPDGTNPQPLGVTGVTPSWHSESYRLAFDRIVAAPSGPAWNHVFAVNRDGTNSGDITPPGSSGFSYVQPVWSPNDGQIAAQRRLCAYTDPSCTEVWRITVFNADGSNLLEIADGTSPDWQRTTQPRYVRPKGATPFMTHFVPAYHACTSANRAHGAPLAFPSCAPPNPTSLNVTAGTPDANGAGAKFLGSATLKVVPGIPANSIDDADVKVTVSMTDIRCTDTTIACTGAELSDYTGSMRLALTVDLTDTYVPNLPASSKGVVSIPIPCAATADPTIGSACGTATTVDSVIPGAVREGNRAIWELGQLEIWDGGQDGSLASRDDDTLFAVQGVFIP